MTSPVTVQLLLSAVGLGIAAAGYGIFAFSDRRFKDRKAKRLLDIEQAYAAGFKAGNSR